MTTNTKDLYFSAKKICQKYFPFFCKPRQLDCIAIAERSGAINSKSRVADFNLAAPDCVCETQTTSRYSVNPVQAKETLTRFAFNPRHFRRNGELNPSIFSQIEKDGCSVQREDSASNDELKLWLNNVLKESTQKWSGVVQARCDDLRQIVVDGSMKRALAIYDTAEKENPSHAEIFQTQYVINEADAGEIRRKIFKAFGDGKVIQPADYRGNALRTSP